MISSRLGAVAVVSVMEIVKVDKVQSNSCH